MGTDRNIRAAVHEQLVTDPLIDAGDIVVEVADGAVSLTGTVPSLAQFTEAAATARRVAAVTTVDNLLAVALPSQGRRDDAALTQLANQALAANPAVPDSVTATAREGTVFPTGTASLSAQRVAAEDTVAGVAGVLSNRSLGRPPRNQAAEADAVIGAARLIVPATSFGGVESSWERRARWPSETAPASLIRLSAGIESALDLIADIAGAVGLTGRSHSPSQPGKCNYYYYYYGSSWVWRCYCLTGRGPASGGWATPPAGDKGGQP